MHTQTATEAIGFQRNGTKYFGEPSCSYATVQFHLPEAILGMHIALCEIEVIFVIRINMGYTVMVSDNFNRVMQSIEAYCPTLLGHRPPGEQRIGTTYEA
jgi:hypothetical protein